MQMNDAEEAKGCLAANEEKWTQAKRKEGGKEAASEPRTPKLDEGQSIHVASSTNERSRQASYCYHHPRYKHLPSTVLASCTSGVYVSYRGLPLYLAAAAGMLHGLVALAYHFSLVRPLLTAKACSPSLIGP